MKNMNNVIIILCLTITITSSQLVKWRGERHEILEFRDWEGVKLLLTCRTAIVGCDGSKIVQQSFLDTRIKEQLAAAQKPILSDRFPSETNQAFAPQELTHNIPATNVPQNVQQRVSTTRRPSTTQPQTIENRVANGILQMGINIFGLTSAGSNDDIQVISPVSIAEATSLIQLGAKGKTLIELMKINGQTPESK